MYSRRSFLFTQYSTIDLLRLERQSAEAEAKRLAAEEATRQKLRLHNQQRAFWALNDAMCRAEPFIGNPHITDLKVMKRLHDAADKLRKELKG